MEKVWRIKHCSYGLHGVLFQLCELIFLFYFIFWKIKFFLFIQLNANFPAVMNAVAEYTEIAVKYIMIAKDAVVTNTLILTDLVGTRVLG